MRELVRRNQPGPYQVQAAIAAVHSDAATAPRTDWRQVVALYDQLYALVPTPVVALNRAVAVAEVAGPAAALALVDELGTADGTSPAMDGYYLFHATRAELLRRLGRAEEAVAAYESARTRTDNEAEQDFLRAQAEGIRRSGRA